MSIHAAPVHVLDEVAQALVAPKNIQVRNRLPPTEIQYRQRPNGVRRRPALARIARQGCLAHRSQTHRRPKIQIEPEPGETGAPRRVLNRPRTGKEGRLEAWVEHSVGVCFATNSYRPERSGPTGFGQPAAPVQKAFLGGRSFIAFALIVSGRRGMSRQ